MSFSNFFCEFVIEIYVWNKLVVSNYKLKIVQESKVTIKIKLRDYNKFATLCKWGYLKGSEMWKFSIE